MKPKIYLGSDHAGFELKEFLETYLIKKGLEVEDMGCHTADSTDYPDFAHLVAGKVLENPGSFGLLVCGSGNGINMAANRHHGIRSALCWKQEIAALARQHNDANILALPGRFISQEEAIRCLETFLDTPFEGGRHGKRVGKIDSAC